MTKSLDKIKKWREFRTLLGTLTAEQQINSVVEYWSKMPLTNFVMDWDDAQSWPTPWEIISEDYYDSVAIAYMMLETLKAVGWDESQFELRYIQDKVDNSRMMILILDNETVLNYSYNEIVSLNDIEAKLANMIRYKLIKNKFEEIE